MDIIKSASAVHQHDEINVVSASTSQQLIRSPLTTSVNSLIRLFDDVVYRRSFSTYFCCALFPIVTQMRLTLCPLNNYLLTYLLSEEQH